MKVRVYYFTQNFQVLGIITLICSLVPPWWGSSGSWVEFVSSSTVIFVILLWFYYFFQLEDRLVSCLWCVPIRVIVSIASIYITFNCINITITDILYLCNLTFNIAIGNDITDLSVPAGTWLQCCLHSILPNWWHSICS